MSFSIESELTTLSAEPEYTSQTLSSVAERLGIDSAQWEELMGKLMKQLLHSSWDEGIMSILRGPKGVVSINLNLFSNQEWAILESQAAMSLSKSPELWMP